MSRFSRTLTLLAAAAALTPVAPASAARSSVVAAPAAVVTPSPAAYTTAAVNPATATCSAPATFKAFALVGDLADYAFAPDGSFESGAAGWSLTGASVTAANETLGVFGGAKALSIRKGGRVVSPWFCVTADHPTFRYVARGGEIEMEIDYMVIGGKDVDDKLVGETNAGSRWTASSVHELATKIPESKLNAGAVARIVFEAEDDVTVDNVLIDPYRRG